MKKIITILITFLFLASPIYADLPDGSDRNGMQNYGVNKKWTINESNLNNVLRTPHVDATKKIYDYANILTDVEEQEIYNEIGKYIENTHMDMVILTINMPYTYDAANEDFAADFYDYNDFGLDFEHYDGVLLLRNAYEQDPYFNVYTFGEAQLYFDFYRCESMLDKIYPYFKTKEYLTGMKMFISEFNYYYGMGKALKDYYVDDMGYIHKLYTVPWLLSIGGGGVVALITILVMVKKNKMIKKATQADDYITKNSVKYNVRSDVLTGSITTHHTVSSSSGGGGGHSSFGGSSGGGHGGGGGRHG